MKKIFLLGRATDSYRAVELTKWFLSNGEKYAISYYDPQFYSPKTRTILRRIAFRLLREVSAFFRVFSLISADCIVVLAMGSGFPLWYLKLAKLLDIPIITDFYISFFDTLVNDRKLVAPCAIQGKRLKRFDKTLIQNSSACVFLNRAERDHYFEVAEIKNFNNSFIVPLCTPEKGKARLDFFQGKRAVVNLCWWGTFIPLHGLEVILHACEILKKKQFTFMLNILGTSEEKAKPYKELAELLNLGNTVLFRNDLRFADDSLPNWLCSNCDIAFGLFGSSKKAKTVLVNKVVESLSMGIPVISQPSEGIVEFLEPGREIETVTAKPENLAEGIQKLISQKEYTLMLAENGLRKYQETFTVSKFTNDFSAIIRKVTGEHD